VIQRTPSGERLYWLLIELGYDDPKGRGLRLPEAASDVSAHSGGAPISAGALRGILYEGREPTLDEAVRLAAGLGIDLLEIAYDGGVPPRARRRRPGVKLMDVIERPYEDV
jgi:hypothetical protein